jgi:hypothetical protein
MDSEHTVHHRHRIRRWAFRLIFAWLLLAYFAIPLVWKYVWFRGVTFSNNPRITETSDRHPGDPLNVALIGTEDEIKAIMKAAQWYPAAALGIVSDLEIGADTILKRSDDDAPVSSLYLFGRKEDLAFEQPVGDSPRHRHHVRFWKTPDEGEDGRPQWIGAAVYDEKVGFSRTTGQITHVTGEDIDKERDYLFTCLDKTKMLAEQYIVKNFHEKHKGFNGGGDPWSTDGNLWVGVVEGDSE